MTSVPRSLVLPIIAVAVLMMTPASADSPVPANNPGYPAWWFTQNVIVRTDSSNLFPVYDAPGTYLAPKDLAPLTIGQLKNFAFGAYNEFQEHLPGGASADVSTLIHSWLQIDPTTGEFLLGTNGLPLETIVTGAGIHSTNDQMIASIGQLKAIVKPFYDQLRLINFVTSYPWDNSPNPPADNAPAVIGQAKKVFSFDLTASPNNDGVPEAWADAFGLGPNTTGSNPQAADADPDNDGLTNAEEYQLGTDPTKKDNPAVKLTAYGFAAP